MEIIPLANPPEPFYKLRVSLDGVDYTLSLEFNQRDGWYLGLSDELEDVIMSPHKLVVDCDFLDGLVDARRPPGMLMLRDMSGAGAEAGYTDLDARCKLVYLPLEELTELEAEVDDGA